MKKLIFASLILTSLNYTKASKLEDLVNAFGDEFVSKANGEQVIEYDNGTRAILNIVDNSDRYDISMNRYNQGGELITTEQYTIKK